MSDPVVDKIQKHPKHLELRKKRNLFGWSLTLLMMVVYYGYIALIAFNKPFLAQPIGTGVTSLGIPIGLGVIVFGVFGAVLCFRVLARLERHASHASP